MGDTYENWQGNGKWQWANATWLPDEIERYVELASTTRVALIDYGLREKAKSIVDKDVAPQNIQEVALYLPRALQVGLFAPFPSTWFDNLSLIRIVAAGEMFIYYLCIPGVFLLLLYNRKPAVFIAVYFACFFLMVYGFTTANIGTLYRLRYAYEFIILLLGVLGWFTWLHKTGRLKRLVDMVQVPRQLPENEGGVIEDTPVKRKEVIVTGSTVMALTLLCFVAFFLRDILMARTFGLGADTDNFFIALLIPMFIVTVFCLPLGAALIPIYLKIKEGGNINDSKALVSNVSFWGTFVLFVICLALYIFGPNLLILLYPDGALPDMSKLVPLMDMSLLILLFSGMVVLGNSVLNAHGKGAQSSAAQLIVPIVAILALYMFGSTYGVLAIMLGMVVGQLLNLIIVQYYLRRYQMSLLPIPKSGGYSQAIFLSSQYFPLAASAFFIAVAAPISTLLAMTLPDGSVSAFNLGSKVVLFITGLVSTTVTTVMLPYFSTLVAKNHLMSARRELSFFLLLATFISIPISGIFFVWADFIVRLLFEGGAFDTKATEQVVRVMQYAVVQLPFFVCNAILLKFATATKHVISISLIAILSLLVNIGVSFLLMKHMGVAGIALGSSVSVIFATVLLVLALVRFWHISKFDALVMLLNWLLFLTLLMGLHFRSVTSVYAVILAYVVLLFGYFSSLNAEKLLKKLGEKLKEKVCFVVSSSMTVNAFLQKPILKLSKYYEIFIILNFKVTDSLPGLDGIVTVLPVEIERKISPWKDLYTLWKIFCFCRSYNFKILHSITPKAGLLAMLAAFLAGIDTRIHTFTGQVWANRNGVVRFILKNLDRLIGFFATKILVDSPSQRQFLLDECVISAKKSNVLHKGSLSGVDLERFKFNSGIRANLRLQLGFSDKDIVFLFIGRLNRDKGVVDLAYAFSKVAESFPNIKLLIVGPDEENISNEINQITHSCANQVRFIGFCHNPEDYMSSADVLCLPSYREGFGNVVIEAAAIGIPTIGSRIYGITDAVVDGETGLLFEVKNISALESCIITMATDSEFRIRLGMQAMSRVYEDFSSTQLESAWLNYYRELS